jgi:hypothetical protein
MSGGPVRGGLAAQCRPEQAMNWRRWLAALFVVLALAGCAQGQPGAQYAPYSPENNGNMHDSGGGGGGSGGM